MSLVSVTAGKPVEGQFDLTDARGKRYVGKFLAKWIELRVLCRLTSRDHTARATKPLIRGPNESSPENRISGLPSCTST